MCRGHVELADLDGCGYAEVISAWMTANGNAQLRAVNYKGEVVWSHELEGVPIARPVWNNGGTSVWAVGEFTEKGKLDVFITFRYDNSVSGRMVDGKTGEIKGNADSGLFHTTESPYHGRTKAEVWFESEEHAKAAGYKPWNWRDAGGE